MRPLHVELGAPLLLPLVWLCPTSSFERKQSHTALPKWLRPSRTSSQVRPYLTPHLVLQQTLAALPPKYIHCLSPSHCHHPGPCCPISLLGKLFPDFAPHNSQDAILKMQTGSCALLHKTFPWGFLRVLACEAWSLPPSLHSFPTQFLPALITGHLAFFQLLMLCTLPLHMLSPLPRLSPTLHPHP